MIEQISDGTLANERHLLRLTGVYCQCALCVPSLWPFRNRPGDYPMNRRASFELLRRKKPRISFCHIDHDLRERAFLLVPLVKYF